ncbi:MAG: hypothetical protein AUJ98_00595 [Bacteroidetes bacterium CG2_30_33_31]|nr:MAG: hypothetical protein AUJ98_00595 [Bacteroidetes bacterium CG2_30_33_31]
MNEQQTDSNAFKSVNLIIFLWSHKKPILIVTLIAAIASMIFSAPFFIPPKFQSQVVLFPTSTNSISKALLSQTQTLKQDVLQFGEEEDAEQLLQVLNSSKIRDRIIQKYNLKRHYDIDKNAKYPQTLLIKEYESNIHYRRTENMAVEITVMDIDPDTSALICNDISALLDSVKIFMQKERALKGFKIVQAEYTELLADMQAKEDSLTVLRKHGIHDYETQAEMINRQMAIEIARNPNSLAVKSLKLMLDTLAIYGGPYVSIRDGLEYEKKHLTEIKAKYDEAKIDAEEELPQTFKVDSAYPAEKKSYPVRWLIVVISTFGSLLLMIFLTIIIDNFKSIKIHE